MTRPLVLSLDTSTPTLSCALLSYEGGIVEVLETRQAAPPAIVSTLVPGLFDEMLLSAGATIGDVGVVVSGLGPGLFTGVRVAVATMKAVAYARRIPLIGAHSLEAMTLAATRGRDAAKGDRFNASGIASGEWFCPVIDARKGEVYFAIQRWHSGAIENRTAPMAAPPKTLVTMLQDSSDARTLGAGAAVLGAEFSATAPLTPGAAEIAALALWRHGVPAFDASQVLALEPTYLRPPEAEVARQKKLAAG